MKQIATCCFTGHRPEKLNVPEEIVIRKLKDAIEDAYHSMSAMNIALNKLCGRNGLPKISVHSLRHIYATLLIEKKVPLVKISALLGHESIHTTFEIYCDVIGEEDNIKDFMNSTFVLSGDEGDINDRSEIATIY